MARSLRDTRTPVGLSAALAGDITMLWSLAPWLSLAAERGTGGRGVCHFPGWLAIAVVTLADPAHDGADSEAPSVR